MEHSDFSAKDLCRIIETCHTNGVSRIKVSGIEIDFGASVPFVVPDYGPSLPVRAEGNDTVLDEGLMEQARLNQLIIDDPLGYEQEMIDSLTEQQRMSHA